VSDETVIPVLPCISLAETLDFYRALGFAVTYEQTTPYVYGAVCRGGANLHFYGGHKKLDPAKTFSSCLVMVDEVSGPHRAFIDGLRRAYGRVPTAGFPRITRLRPGQSRFGVFDPAGNSIIFIARDEPDMTYDDEPVERSRLAQALDTAVWLRDLKGFDDVAAAKVLDVALARDADGSPLERARVLAARAELAVALGDAERARTMRSELAQISLTAEEREHFKEELQAADELEQLLS
jgi:catechol 2,3-dioxygenase-like lactoylglutathione lyase family enzyme